MITSRYTHDNAAASRVLQIVRAIPETEVGSRLRGFGEPDCGNGASGLRLAPSLACEVSSLQGDGGLLNINRRLVDEPELAGVAQLVEHLICNQRVGGSSPFTGSLVFR